MKNFKIIEVEKLKNPSNYELIEEGVYNDLSDKGGFSAHRIAMEMELEDGEDSQYPLEDILDKYYVHIEDFLASEDPKKLKFILGGELDSIQKFKSIVGKRAYNEEYLDEEGQKRIRLKIE